METIQSSFRDVVAAAGGGGGGGDGGGNGGEGGGGGGGRGGGSPWARSACAHVIALNEIIAGATARFKARGGGDGGGRDAKEARVDGAFDSHWFPYDPVGVVNAVS